MKAFLEKLTVILFCALLGLCALLFVILPDRQESPEENRSLAQIPKLTASSLLSGEFTSDMNVYFADQFPFRNALVRIKSGTELLLLKGENNGVLYRRDQLAVRSFHAYRSRVRICENTDRYYEESLSAQLDAFRAFGEGAAVPVLTLLPPRTIDVTDASFAYDRPNGDSLFSQIREKELPGYIEILPLLREKYEDGEYVYYRTDHHWTTLGAYYAYGEVMKALGREGEILPASAFTIEEIGDFSGTTAAKGSFPLYREDVVQLWHLPHEGAYAVIADGEQLPGFYVRSHLETRDKYAVFLDGTHNLVTVTKEGEPRPTLLIAKDSFADSLIPFLASSYNIVAVNLKSHTDLTPLIEQYDPEAVLVVYNIENIITSGDLGNLR